MWGASLGHFCHNYAYYFVLSWLPLFLVKAHGFSVPAMAEIGAGIYAVQAVSAVVTGWVSDRWIVAGATPNRVQKTLLVTAMVGVALTMMACAAAGPTLSVALLAAAAMFFGMTVPNIYAIAQTLGGHRAAGQWMGIQNLIGNLAGVLAPLITGFVVDRTDHYYWACVIAALIAFVGSLAFGVVIRRIEPIAWSEISLAPATVLE